MLLVVVAICGLLAGFHRAMVNKRRLSLPIVRWWWLLVPSAAATWITRYFALSIPMVITVLLLSQALPLIVAWANRRQPGMWLLGAGLALNLLVISLNGGFMPISPETLQAMGVSPECWIIGQRLGLSKDVVRPIAETNLWLLSDWLLPPTWFPKRGAFSIGDVCAGAGVFWILWTATELTRKS